jgi:hypothetical protein
MSYVTLDLASRRRVLAGAAGLALIVLTAGVAQAAPAKSSQKAVEYQTHPKAGHACNTCKDFKPPGSCKSVEGDIEASGWCNKYTHS